MESGGVTHVNRIVSLLPTDGVKVYSFAKLKKAIQADEEVRQIFNIVDPFNHETLYIQSDAYITLKSHLLEYPDTDEDINEFYPWRIYDTYGVKILFDKGKCKYDINNSTVDTVFKISWLPDSNWGYIRLAVYRKNIYNKYNYNKNSILTFYVFKSRESQKQFFADPPIIFNGIDYKFGQYYFPLVDGQYIQLILDEDNIFQMKGCDFLAFQSEAIKASAGNGNLLLYTYRCTKAVKAANIIHVPYIYVNNNKEKNDFSQSVVLFPHWENMDYENDIISYPVIIEPHEKSYINTQNINCFMLKFRGAVPTLEFDTDFFDPLFFDIDGKGILIGLRESYRHVVMKRDYQKNKLAMMVG